MSMLTPPGMGGQYRVTGDRYPRMRRPRRHRRTAAAAVAAVAALGLLSWGTVQLVDVFTGGGTTVRAAGDGRSCEPGTSDASDASDSKPAAGSAAPAPSDGGAGRSGDDGRDGESGRADGPDEPPEPSAITVNVYNATPRSGLAKDTADELKKRGFTIGEVANAPADLDKKVKATGLLVGPPAAYRTGAFDVLKTQLDGAEVRTVDRKGEEVDLVIGTAFKDLAKRKDAEKALAALADPSPSPSPGPAC